MRKSAKENPTRESIEDTLQILQIAQSMFDQVISTHLDEHSANLVISYLVKVITETIENQEKSIEAILVKVTYSVAFLNLSKRMYLDDDYVLSHIEMARELWNSLHAEKSHFYCK